MPGSQPGCEETRFTGDEKPASWLARASDLIKKRSDALLRDKMRLSTTVTLCTVACGLAPTKVFALCRKRQGLGQIEASKEQLA